MSIVTFPKTRPEDRVFVCNCGCATFVLRGDGEVLCRACETPLNAPEVGGWYDIAKDAGETTTVPVYSANGISHEFAEKLVKKRVATDSVDWLIFGNFDGSITSWCRDSLTDEQYEWMMRRTKDGIDMMERYKP